MPISELSKVQPDHDTSLAQRERILNSDCGAVLQYQKVAPKNFANKLRRHLRRIERTEKNKLTILRTEPIRTSRMNYEVDISGSRLRSNQLTA